MKTAVTGLFCAFLILPTHAQNSRPEPRPIVDSIPAARDIVHPGVLKLDVDLRDVARGIFRVNETLPVGGPGPVTLLFPKWIPGNHTDSGQISKLAGLRVTAAGRALDWRRDAVDVFAFHVDVPAGVTSLSLEFQFLSATDEAQGRIVATPEMLNLQWNSVVLYPAGYYARQITVAPSLTLPAGWKAATALEPAGTADGVVRYQPVPLDTLIDSPVFAGAHVRVETLAPGVRLNIVADRPGDLAATAEQLAWHRDLVTQADRLFGARHFDHYDFLLALSSRQGSIGLEHHRSSENGVPPGYFLEWKDHAAVRSLLPHEYVHSWNGKFRRPAELWTPDYRTPMRDELLWVYEGLTEYWGIVLAARCGLLSRDEALGAVAQFSASMAAMPGRQWRPLLDTTHDPIIARRQPKGWTSWQRSEDYYIEGMLVWLDADTLIRELSQGRRSLDDFARAFFGMRDGDWGSVTYDLAEVIRVLNGVQPHDWAAFFRPRVEQPGGLAPLDGLARGGYRLVFSESPTDWFKSGEKLRRITDLRYSGGLVLGRDGDVTGVVWDSPAFAAGLTVGSRIIAVNQRAYSADLLKAAIKARTSPLELLVKTGDIFRTVPLNYTGGLRYPQIERTGAGPGSLDALLAPRP